MRIVVVAVCRRFVTVCAPYGRGTSLGRVKVRGEPRGPSPGRDSRKRAGRRRRAGVAGVARRPSGLGHQTRDTNAVKISDTLRGRTAQTDDDDDESEIAIQYYRTE